MDHPVRFVTATALFDGHDASINIVRRVLQAQGAEVVHLGHNRGVDEIVEAVVEEDVQGLAVSSYQGGHLEFFEYLVKCLAERDRSNVRVFGGGGGVIVPDEIAKLAAIGVRVFSPEDGARLGLVGMAEVMVAEAAEGAVDQVWDVAALRAGDVGRLARTISGLELGLVSDAVRAELEAAAKGRAVPVLGVTGTGGSGKSSLTDEIIRRFRLDARTTPRIAVLAIDPTRRRGGGALLGDRIRMNAIHGTEVLFRSIATRGDSEVPRFVPEAVTACKAAGYDLVIVETPGIGQGDAGITEVADLSLYVMTPEFGAATQLEKIDMLDFADVVAINKFERRGADDALRDVGRQLVRNRGAFTEGPDAMPVFGTIAARFNDDGVSALYGHLRERLESMGLPLSDRLVPIPSTRIPSSRSPIVPNNRTRYLAEIAETMRGYHADTEAMADAARVAQHLQTAAERLPEVNAVADAAKLAAAEVSPEAARIVEAWPATVAEYAQPTMILPSAGGETSVPLRRRTLSGSEIPRVALPRLSDHGDLVRWHRRENLPGRFPFTAGVFGLKRDDEEPTRMFAGEGDPFRTNARFHLLAKEGGSTRLSTAFDSVTLYGNDPDERPDIYGKVGNSGVSVCTLDDMHALFDGFDLVAPTTSVSMTINGPAPAVLATYLNTAIDQRLRRLTEELGREPTSEEAAACRAEVLRRVRGTVQADVLKEDQGQNTCIFTTEFALRMMGDMQQWFIDQDVRNFYSVSISGYHIAEAGANPITQLAFTLANAFTYVEYYLARGMDVDDFASNLSFFFSNGMDPEYAVLGRVARRVWAVAMRDRYGADERSQRLKYHVQTSGRSLHAQEMQFNDIRTTLQALIAVYDNCNSLHTNAYDEAVTTPTAESVRRALAIQLIINREWGLTMNENPNQGSFVIDELTDLVEAAVLEEFERLSERGGVLGAMETGYQRGRIQDESLLYEHRKHDGSLPIVGVNTFRAESTAQAVVPPSGLSRSTEAEKQSQIERLRRFKTAHAEDRTAALERLRQAALTDGNTFAVLMDAVRCCSLGEITDTLFEVGGRYRRNL